MAKNCLVSKLPRSILPYVSAWLDCYEKFRTIHDKQVQKYGRCLTIVLGEFDGREAAFLLQNMFPVKEYSFHPPRGQHQHETIPPASRKRKNGCLSRYFPLGFVNHKYAVKVGLVCPVYLVLGVVHSD